MGIGISRLLSKLSKEGKDNDEAFFRCRKCFAETKVLYTYESAEESGFTCECGNRLTVAE